MKSSHYYRLLVFALSLSCTPLWAAGFGDIPASLALPAGTSVRRNAGNTLFESYTPSTGTVTSIATTSPITGGTITTTGTIAINDAAADGTTKGASTYTASDFNATSGVISIDYTNGQAASSSLKGFLTAADWTTFNGKGSGSVTSVGLAGTSNQITVTGSTPITTSGSWTLSIPTAAQLNVAKLTNLTTNGFVTTSGSDGTLGVSAIVGGFTAHFSRGGVAIQTNDTIITPWTCPYSGTITGYSISANSGTCTLKTWKKANGTAIPTIADVINTSGVSLSSGTHIRSSTVSDFTTVAVTAGDMFMAQVTATSGPTDITFQVEITR